MTSAFSFPVDQFLTLGEARLNDWPDYVATYGLNADHVPELIRMATDRSLNTADSGSKDVWGPLHAWRALGQLHAESAADPLSNLFAETADWDDYAHEELPIVLGMIGPASIPGLTRLLHDDSLELFNRTGAVRGLGEVAKRSPDLRDEVVAILMRQLESYEDQDDYLTTSLVHELTELRATEAAGLIEKAFAADCIDITYRGDWEDVQIDLGLLEERTTPRPDFRAMYRRFGLTTERTNASLASVEKAKAKAKKKRKDAKAARKRNRRR